MERRPQPSSAFQPLSADAVTRTPAGRRMPPRNDHDTAHELAASAGELLLQLRGRGFPDAAARKAADDAESHTFLLDRLRERRPGDAVLSEEGIDDAARLGVDRVWIAVPTSSPAPASSPSPTAGTGRCTSPSGSAAG